MDQHDVINRHDIIKKLPTRHHQETDYDIIKKCPTRRHFRESGNPVFAKATPDRPGKAFHLSPR